MTLTPLGTERRRPWRRGLPVGIITALALGVLATIGVLTSGHPVPRGPDPVRLVPVPGGVAAVSQ